MNPSLTENAKALLLLTAPLQVGGRSNESDPVLSPGEYNKLAEQLRKLGRVPEDLLGPDQDSIVTELGPRLDPDRIRHLLERGILLGQALELWQARGIWVVCRADCHYPKRLKTRLKQYAPPVLFGVGDPDLLERGGLAVVGSRKVDDNIIAFTEELGAATAAAGHSIVSGGARGVDQASMRGALEAEGTCIGVLAERLMKMAVDSTAREALRDRRLVFVSAVDPQARFNVGNAMQRNKYIYALADVALVVNTDYQKGGTWAGAVEQLDRFHACPVFVRNGDSIPKGNQALLERGASPWPENLEGDVLQKLLENPGAFQTNGQAELLHLGLDAPAELQVEEAPQAMEASDPTQDIANGESSKGIQQEFPELNDQ